MAHSLLRPRNEMASPRNDDDLVCSCRHPACKITSLWRSASAVRAEARAIPEPLPFDLSDTVVTPVANRRAASQA
jgi:hypothetical protein